MLNGSQEKILERTAKSLGVPFSWLYELIKFETAGTFSPSIGNNLSSARGLIQFIDATAQKLGYASSLDLVKRHPTFESQMEGPVYRYLSQFRPFPTKQSLFMAVFYPAFRNVPEGTSFPARIQSSNPGIKTVADYMNKASGVAQKVAGASILIIGIGAYFYLRSST